MSAERLAELILEHQPCVVLTGAGVSTESGIPDFRSPSGTWARYDPMEYATIEAFRRDPVKVWDFYARRLEAFRDARPNAAHHALAALERAGFVQAVVTQNIDRLHELAGSRNVIEVHGSIRTSSCLACGERASFDEVVRMLEQAPAPSCPRCGSILKPDVVMFGEYLPEEAIERASELARRARLLLGRGLLAERLPGRRPAPGDPGHGREARDRQQRADAIRRPRGACDLRCGRRDALSRPPAPGAGGGPGAAVAAGL